MAHTVIPPPRGTNATLELTHEGNINDKTIPERDREVRDFNVTLLARAITRNIGTVYQAQGEYAKALVQLQKSLKIDIRMLGCKHENLAVSYLCIVYWIEVNLNNLKTTLINHTRFRTKGQSAGYPQAQIETTSNCFQRRAP